MFVLQSNPFIEPFFISSYVLKCWSVQDRCIEINDNLKENNLNTRRVVKFPIEMVITSLTTFTTCDRATISCQ